MISFWVDRAGEFTIQNYRKARGADIRDHFLPRCYDWQEAVLEVPAGRHLFAALDRLSETEREAVGSLYDQLAAQQPGFRPLNDPRRCLLRPALLNALADAGLNSFRVYPVEAVSRIERFPVFVRESHDHSGSLTPPLESRAAVLRALRGLRLRGYRPAELLIVEYCDTSGDDGLFRKYAAFKVGDALIPTHLMASEHWMVKSDTTSRTLEIARENMVYAEENPHKEWLRRVFTLAEIDYGRVDFGLLNGRPQVWEINLNPNIGRAPGAPDRPSEPAAAELLDQARQLWHRRLREAFVALDGTASRETVLLRLDPRLLKKIRAEQTRSRHRELVWSSLRKWYQHPRIGAPLRVLSRLVPSK